MIFVLDVSHEMLAFQATVMVQMPSDIPVGSFVSSKFDIHMPCDIWGSHLCCGAALPLPLPPGTPLPGAPWAGGLTPLSIDICENSMGISSLRPFALLRFFVGSWDFGRESCWSPSKRSAWSSLACRTRRFNSAFSAAAAARSSWDFTTKLKDVGTCTTCR